MAGAETGQGSLSQQLQPEGSIYLTEVNHASRRDGNPITMATVPTDCNGVTTSQSEEETESPTGGEDSSSDESTDDDDDDDYDDETVLRKAGVKLQLLDLQELDKAPLTLLTEFVSCCVGDKYRAASILCSHILKLEPDNQVARQFLPILEERLQLDKSLPTESSSEDEDESGSGQDTSSTDTDNSEN